MRSGTPEKGGADPLEVWEKRRDGRDVIPIEGVAVMITRRSFVQASATVVAAPFVHAAPARKTYRACIIGATGRGGYGHGLDVCFQKLPNVSVVALADPSEPGRAAALK